MSLKKKMISGTKWTTISTIVLAIFQLVQLVVLVRMLDSKSFGLIGIVTIIIGFADAFTDMGISNAIIHKQNVTRKHLASLYWVNLIAGIIIFSCVQVLAPFIAQFYNEPEIKSLLGYMGFIFLIVPLGQQFQVLLQKELEFNTIAKIEIISSLVGTTVSISCAYVGLGAISLVWGQLGNALIRTTFLFTLGFKRFRPSLYFNFNEIRSYIKYGMYQMGDRVVNYFNFNTDSIIIGKMLGVQALGLYTLASNIINLPASKINPIFTRVAFPAFSRVQNNQKLLKEGYLKIINILSVINFPIFLGLIIVAPLLVPILFGEKWLESVILFQILAIAGLLRSIGNPIGALLMAKGRVDWGFKFNLLKTALQLLGIVIGAYFGGIVGAAIAKVILAIFDIIFSYFYLLKRLIGNCLKSYLMNMFSPLWMSIVMVLIVLGSSLVLATLSQTYLLIFQVTIGILVYGFLISKYERTIISQFKNNN